MQIARRSFIAALGAAFSTSVLAGPCAMSRPSVNWELFTCLEYIRFDIGTPWKLHESTVGTDGRILLSVDGYVDAVGDAETRRPDLSMIPWDSFDSAGWKSSRDIQPGKEHEGMCPNCMGTSRIGSGVIRVVSRGLDPRDLDYDWEGGEPCDGCGGEGWKLKTPSLVADGTFLQAGYINRIKTMGDFDWKIDEAQRTIPYGPSKLLLFRNAVGRGALTCLDI